MDHVAVDIESNLVDLSTITLDELASCDESDLAGTVARLLRRIDEPVRHISSYNPQRID
jgi:hypothetical protein